MPIQQFIILDAPGDTSARSFNIVWARIEPRPVNTASPGTVTDQNSNVVDLVGKRLAPRRIVLDPLYRAGMRAFLLNLPFANIDSATVFLPDPAS